MGSGKAQPIYSKVMTKNGYKKIGKLNVGDLVYGEDGKLHKVLGIYPQGYKDVYEIILSDGSKTRSCGEHLWTYQLPQDKAVNRFRTSTLYGIMDLDLYKKTNRNDKNWQIFIPLTKPLEIPEIKLDIDAYAMGLLLGDGGFTNSSIKFSNSEKDILHKLQILLGDQFKLKRIGNKNDFNITDKNKIYYGIGVKKYNHRLRYELNELGLLGLKSNEKFIPQKYLFNSIENRIKILQGLIDTDGEVYGNNICFSTSSKKLAYDVQFLIHSLGGTCKIKIKQSYYTYKGQKKQGLPSFRLYIKIPDNIKIFTSQKHKLKYKKGNTNPCRSIRDIKYIGKEECVCIYINNPTHLYLTDDMVVTHNTEMAIKIIKNNPQNKYIYITPYLDEIKRVREATNDYNKMYEPQYIKSTKQENLHKLLREGKNICSTHALFQKSNDITREALKANNYTLILDEVMDVVEELDNFTKHDLETLLSEDLAYIEDDYLLWNENKLHYNGRYNDIMNMAINKNLICINDKLLYWNFPVDIFNYFKEVYILTYMFDCQIQRYYYDFYNIEYEKYQIENMKLMQYKKNRNDNIIRELNKLIYIYDGNLNSIGDNYYALSFSWYEKDDGTLQGILQNNIYNWFNNINRKHTSKYRLWTTFKDNKSNLKGKGYTNKFISINTRATNDYKDTYILAYCVNRFVKPTMVQFFNKRGVNIDQEEYALSEMLQWIWRSRIREGKPIKIFIPSKRMRELLINYLN